PLSSCNYGCTYCPFAKHTETSTERQADSVALTRFVNWIENQSQIQFSLLFTPWGEALNRTRYQQALIKLTNLPNVKKAAIQTNLSCRLDWVEQCNKLSLALWTTYHPTQVSRQRFIAKCHSLIKRGVRFSVGVVGLKEHLSEIKALRSELPANIYLWGNAYKREPNYYTADELQFITSLDPLFPINNQRHASFGKSCRAGQAVISVDGTGTIHRCHFVPKPLGNIYDPSFSEILRERLCPNQTCDCHIGYVHLKELRLEEVFREGILERIPHSYANSLK
ncbi:MAG TPA: STM4011 family radical SAM protein, partial [Blastocatellia bacterium]|nr:STM4011 family radical SAM protein [Blastocatellia bacterium]